MANEMRDRRVELLQEAQYKWTYSMDNFENVCADHLIENGVIIPPCKVGQTIYMLFEGEITPLLITRISTIETVGEFSRCYDATGKNVATSFTDNHIGKTMFLTKAEAEQKLKEMRGDDK